jgi:hypothetical protein
VVFAVTALAFVGIAVTIWWVRRPEEQVSVRTGADCPKPTNMISTSSSPGTTVPDNASEVVSLDRLPDLGGAPEGAEELVSAARSWGRSHPDDFGGVFLAGSHVYVVMARSPQQNLADVRTHVDHPDQLRAVAGHYSLVALQEIAERIGSDRTTLEAEGIHLSSWGADEYHNGVRVSVSDSNPTTAQRLIDRYGQAVRVDLGVTICAL